MVHKLICILNSSREGLIVKKLTLRSVVYALPIVIALIAVSIRFWGNAWYWIRAYTVERVNLNDINYSEKLEECYVYGKINELYVCYREEQKDITELEKEYIMKTSDNHYIGLLIKSGFTKAEEVMKLSVAQLQGVDDEKELEEAKYDIVGVLKIMPLDSQFKYFSALERENLPKAQSTTYCIDVLDIEEDIVEPLIGCIVSGGVGMFLLFYSLAGEFQKDIKKYISNEKGSKVYRREKVENFLKNAPCKYNLRFDSQFLCNRRGMWTTFLETQKIIMAYKKTRIVKYKIFIPVYKSCELVLITTDGKKKTIDFRRERYVDEVLEVLQEICLNLKTGGAKQ